MDSSPLILAQSHARQAVAVSSVDPTKALGEHDRAASQYAAAAKDTSNSEAFRTLKLLEGYHQRLSQLIQFQTTHPVPPSAETSSEEKSAATPTPSLPPPKSEDSPYRSHDEAHQRQPQILQPPTTSSIASNLASARGIPPHRQRRGSPASPASSTQHAEGKLSTPHRRSKLGDYSSRAASNPIQEKVQAAKDSNPPPPEPPAKIERENRQAVPSTDEPFARFYSTFSPLISALSAPLAFAGLPLGLDQRSTSTSQPPTKPTNTAAAITPSSKPGPKADSTASVPSSITENPDYTRAFSRAALRALHLNAQESFYVVPTAGGQISYADILSRTQREAARGLGYPESLLFNTNDDEQEFVDARETPPSGGPPSPVAQRGGAGAVRGKGGKTMEELELENRAMRDLLDVLSKRLAQFEMGSQSQSQALWQSFRMMNPGGAPNPQVGTPQTAVSGGDRDGRVDGERVRGLEEEVDRARKEMERMGRENEKLKGVVGRYRERWEKLKEGARGRREGTGTGAAG
ncbi:MAG: hypothetical protein Q9191_004016 [Dirinaria sp. TL-2023a]